MGKLQRNKDIILFIAAVVILVIFCLLPPMDGLTQSAMRLLGIFFASVLLWMTVGITWPSLFSLLALATLPELSLNELVAASIGNSAISFLIFTFCCSYALNRTPFTKRCAIWFVTRRLARRGPWMFLGLYFVSILILGSCMSTTVIVLIYLNINEEIFKVLGLKKGDKFSSLMTMGLVITASISGAMTPIAHVFPLIALNFYTSITGITIDYLSYMAAGVPAALLSVGGMLLIFRFVLHPDVSGIRSVDPDPLKQLLEPARRKEKITVAIFGLVVALWVLPDLMKGILPAVCAWVSSFGMVMPPLLGTLLLCMIRVEDRPLLTLEEGAKSVPWPSLFMAASALALGGTMTNTDIGLTDFIKQRIGPMTSSLDGMVLVVSLLLITALMTNIGSNMVTVTIISTVAIPIVLALDNNVHAGALAVVLGMMSAYAFATPPAMTTVVLGTGSGWTTNAQMAKYGFLVLFPCILAVAFIAYPIAANLL